MARRRKTGQIILWIVIGIMVIAMAGFGVNSTLQSTSNNTIMKVGKTEITTSEYLNALSGAIENISSQQGTPLSMEEAKLLNIPQQIKTQVINQATFEEMARLNKIRASDQAIAKALVSIPAFQDALGNFSQNNFKIFLDRNTLTEDEFLAQIRRDLDRQLVYDIMAEQRLDLPNLSHAILEKLGEKRAVSYLTLTAQDMPPIDPPSDEEIRALYDADPTQYLGDPKRLYQIAYLVPDVSAITTDQVVAYYAGHLEDYNQGAAASYQTLTFPNEDDAKAFYDNPDFEAIAAERGLNASDYTFADASFSALPEEIQQEIRQNGPGLLPPVKSAFGWNVYLINSYQENSQTPMEDVEDQIRTQLATAQINDLLTPEYETIISAIESGASPEEIAQTTPLQFVEWSNDEAMIKDLTDQAEFGSEATAAQIDEERELVKLSNGGVFVLRLLSEDEAQPLPFDEVKDSIRESITNENLNTALDAEMDAWLTLAQSTSLESLAEEKSLAIQSNAPVTSDAAFTAVPLGIAFDMFQKPKDEIWAAQGDNERYIVQVSQITPFDPASADGASLSQSLSEKVDGSITEGMIIDYLNAAAQEYGAVEYPARIEQVEAQIR